jgi:hypothetical protein
MQENPISKAFRELEQAAITHDLRAEKVANIRATLFGEDLLKSVTSTLAE